MAVRRSCELQAIARRFAGVMKFEPDECEVVRCGPRRCAVLNPYLRLVWFETDLFWLGFGASTLLDWIPGYQHRCPLLRVKDGKPNPAGGFTDLGDGSIVRHKNAHRYIAERDDQPDPARTARVGCAYVRTLRGRPHGHRLG